MEMLTLSLHTIISNLGIYTYAGFCVKRLIIVSGCPHKQIDQKARVGGGTLPLKENGRLDQLLR